MSVESLKQEMPDYAKDIKLNLSSLISKGSGELSHAQILGMALASAYATGQTNVIAQLQLAAAEILDEQHINAAKAAATIMAMNNVYYRSIHLLEDDDYQSLPAQLRMNILNQHGIEKIDFELYSLAISAINGCGMCLNAHAKVLLRAGLAKQSVQMALRISAVVNACAQVMVINDSSSH